MSFFGKITIEGWGTVRLYWGTETQTQDADLVASGVLHPAYRGTCYAVFLDLFIGKDRASAPNIEFTISRYPLPAWLTAAKAIEEDANPQESSKVTPGEQWGGRIMGVGGFEDSVSARRRGAGSRDPHW